MSNSRHRKLINRKRRIANRLRERVWSPRDEPMLRASNIHYDCPSGFAAWARAASGRCTFWRGRPA